MDLRRILYNIISITIHLIYKEMHYLNQVKDTVNITLRFINILYMIDRDGAYINTYDLLTTQFTKNTFNQNIPIGVGLRGCLASTNDVLYVIGGSKRNNLQIFSLSIHSWSEGPNMQQIREYHSCIAVPTINTLYAIGGIFNEGLTSIEFISLICIDIDNNSWQYTDQELSEGVGFSRAVLYNVLIYVIGGKSGDYQSFPDDVYIIDTTDNTVSISSHKLSYGGSSPSTIVINHLVYSFGGRIGAGSTDQWQYYRLPTQDPTALPSNAPTEAPHTLSPISLPTVQPTSQPTSHPTAQPTSQPSNAPTNTPKPTLFAYIPRGVTLEPMKDPTYFPIATTDGRMTTSQLTHSDSSLNTMNIYLFMVIVGGILVTIIIIAILAHVFVQKRSDSLRDQQTIEPGTGPQSKVQVVCIQEGSTATNAYGLQQDTIEKKTRNNSHSNNNWDDEESVTFSVDNKGTTTGGVVFKLPQQNITKRAFM
eukprot:1042798_1